MKTLLPLIIILLLAACTSSHSTPTSPPLTPAAQNPPAAPAPPNFLARTVDSTWKTIKKPIDLLLPKKSPPATEPASQPAPSAAKATIVVPGHSDPSVSPMRIPTNDFDK